MYSFLQRLIEALRREVPGRIGTLKETFMLKKEHDDLLQEARIAVDVSENCGRLSLRKPRQLAGQCSREIGDWL